MDPNEPYLQLREDQAQERLDEQVQKAHEQLLQLKRQQELIERQKRELEELSKRQEQFQLGKQEMVDHFTRAVVVLERETYDAQRRVEQLRSVHQSFLQHLDTLEAIDPKTWDPGDLNKELNKALSAVDDARAEFQRSRALVNAESDEEVLGHDGDGASDQGVLGELSEYGFGFWLKSGLAFTLPLLILGLVILAVLLSR